MKKINKEKIKTWFVTGASSGVGHELCKQLLDRDYNVVAVSRRIPDFKHKNAFCLSCDVTDPESVKEAINKGIEHFKKIDVVSNNAGISANITLEEETLTGMKSVMETNFFGTFNIIHSILPHFRQNKNGTIINNTSQSGISCRAFGSAYVSSKHAIEGLTSVCWHEAKDFCRVMAVELGYFSDTEIMKKAISKKSEIEEYKHLDWFYKKYKKNFKNNLSKAVDCIIQEAEKEKMQRRLMLGKDALIQIGSEIDWVKKDYNASIARALSCSETNKTNLFKKILNKFKLYKEK